MLRITHAQTETEQRWTLCGQLTRPWVDELRACWEESRGDAIRRNTVVDLSDVTFIDESGEQLLSQMRGDGVKFIAAGVDTRHLLSHLKAKGERSLRRLIAPLTGQCGTSRIAKDEGIK